MSDPMDYYKEFGCDKVGLTASDGMGSLHGVLKTPEKHGPGHWACAYLTPKEMRNLASELIKLSVAIEKEKKKGSK